MFDLSAPVQYVKGVGPERAKALVREGFATAEDLLFRLPMRYEDRRLRTRTETHRCTSFRSSQHSPFSDGQVNITKPR